MADRTEKVILEFDIDEEESIESINNLTKANKELRAERNALNLQSEAGKKRAQEINALLDQNTNKIKTNVSAIEKQKINIGNYKSALDGVHPALGKVADGLDKGASGFAAMAKQALAFIATPIGAALAAIVAVFTLLKSALSQNDELMEKFENITNAVGVVLEVVVARVGELGEALIKLASGDFTGAIDSAKEAFSGLGDEIANAVIQQQLFLDASRDLEDDTRALNIQIARTENELKKLRVASKDRTKSLEEQEDIIRKTIALEEDLVRQKEDLARRDLLITARQTRAEKEFQQQANENFEQYIQRLLDSSELSGAEKDKIAQKQIAFENARGASLDEQQKSLNQLAAIEKERAEALEKTNAALAEQAAQERAIRRGQAADIQQAQKTGADFLSDSKAQELKTTTDFNKLMLDANKKFYEDDAKFKAESARVKEDIDQATLAVTANVLGTTAQLFDQSTAQFKILATAQTLISTYSAAQKSYESLSVIPIAGPALGAVAAATAVIAGLARVAAINNIKFAEGGYTGPGHRLKPAGIVHAGEVVWSQEDVRRVGGPGRANAMRPTFPKAGVYTHADGGIVVDSLTSSTNQQLALSNIIKSIPPGEVSVVEIARVDRRVKVKEKISKR